MMEIINYQKLKLGPGISINYKTNHEYTESQYTIFYYYPPKN